MSCDVENTDDEDFMGSSSAASSEDESCEGADGGSASGSGSDRGGGGPGGSGSLAGGPPGQVHAVLQGVPQGGSAPAEELQRVSKQFGRDDKRALCRAVKRIRAVMRRPGIKNSGIRWAWVMSRKRQGKHCRSEVVADPVLAALFKKQSMVAAIEAAVTAGSSNRRTVQCSADSAAAANINHDQRKQLCAQWCSNLRSAGVLEAFTAPDGSWPEEWGLADFNFRNPASICASQVCTVAGEPVKQIDALIDALAANAAQYAPSEEELEQRPACVTAPLLVCCLMPEWSRKYCVVTRVVCLWIACGDVTVSRLSIVLQVPRYLQSAVRRRPDCAAERTGAAPACASGLSVRTVGAAAAHAAHCAASRERERHHAGTAAPLVQ